MTSQENNYLLKRLRIKNECEVILKTALSLAQIYLDEGSPLTASKVLIEASEKVQKKWAQVEG